MTIVMYQNTPYLFAKGASEMVLQNCDFYIGERGDQQKLDDDMKY